MSAARVCTVTTVLDTLPHVQRFVRGNLASGVDHVFLVLDAPDAPGQAEVRAWLEEQPDVTCIVGDRRWWGGDRPPRLNVRQRINANAVKDALADLPWAAWLFHIDGDEIVQIPDGALDAVPAELDAVRLGACEAVAQHHWDGDPTWFKPVLDEPELHLLWMLGVIEEPRIGMFFRGHARGKAGCRPSRPGWFTLHDVVDGERQKLPEHADERLRLLHYESYSGEEFVRKWTAMLESGPPVSLRRKRGNVAAAVDALIRRGLSADEVAPYLMRLFERTEMDDFQTLRDLRMLIHVDPLAGTHVPASLDERERAALREALRRLDGQGKRRYHAQGRTGPGNRAGARKGAKWARRRPRKTS